MRSRTTTILLATLALWSTTYTAAQAELPNDRVAEYYIRETPSDPESNVVLIVTLELAAVDQVGDEIAWEITEITLTKPSLGNEPATVWADDAPAPDTPDGYWLVEHPDPARPQAKEFDWPPLLEGTAHAEDSADDDMEYELNGDYCDPSCQQLFGGDVGTLDYVFTLATKEDPEEEGEDEPVEITGDVIPA